MNARTQGLVLLLFGGALVRLASGDTLLRYVRPVARPWILLAGLVIVGLAAWTFMVGERVHDDDEHDDGHGTGHGTVSRAAWLVVLPVVALLVIAPPALGAYTARHAAVSIAKPASVDFPPLPKGNPVDDGLDDFAVRAIWDDGRTLSGRTVRLTGFVVGSTAASFTIARLVITCCAADARPIEVAVRTTTSAPADGQWVVVTARYAGANPSDPNVPVVTAVSVRPISPPSNPYD
jgi:uncharacterized repeat protein (TIGR03943 family)